MMKSEPEVSIKNERPGRRRSGPPREARRGFREGNEALPVVSPSCPTSSGDVEVCNENEKSFYKRMKKEMVAGAAAGSKSLYGK